MHRVVLKQYIINLFKLNFQKISWNGMTVCILLTFSRMTTSCHGSSFGWQFTGIFLNLAHSVSHHGSQHFWRKNVKKITCLSYERILTSVWLSYVFVGRANRRLSSSGKWKLYDLFWSSGNVGIEFVSHEIKIDLKLLFLEFYDF